MEETPDVSSAAAIGSTVPRNRKRLHVDEQESSVDEITVDGPVPTKKRRTDAVPEGGSESLTYSSHAASAQPTRSSTMEAASALQLAKAPSPCNNPDAAGNASADASAAPSLESGHLVIQDSPSEAASASTTNRSRLAAPSTCKMCGTDANGKKQHVLFHLFESAGIGRYRCKSCDFQHNVLNSVIQHVGLRHNVAALKTFAQVHHIDAIHELTTSQQELPPSASISLAPRSLHIHSVAADLNGPQVHSETSAVFQDNALQGDGTSTLPTCAVDSRESRRKRPHQAAPSPIEVITIEDDVPRKYPRLDPLADYISSVNWASRPTSATSLSLANDTSRQQDHNHSSLTSRSSIVSEMPQAGYESPTYPDRSASDQAVLQTGHGSPTYSIDPVPEQGSCSSNPFSSALPSHNPDTTVLPSVVASAASSLEISHRAAGTATSSLINGSSEAASAQEFPHSRDDTTPMECEPNGAADRVTMDFSATLACSEIAASPDGTTATSDVSSDSATQGCKSQLVRKPGDDDSTDLAIGYSMSPDEPPVHRTVDELVEELLAAAVSAADSLDTPTSLLVAHPQASTLSNIVEYNATDSDSQLSHSLSSRPFDVESEITTQDQLSAYDQITDAHTLSIDVSQSLSVSESMDRQSYETATEHSIALNCRIGDDSDLITFPLEVASTTPRVFLCAASCVDRRLSSEVVARSSIIRLDGDEYIESVLDAPTSPECKAPTTSDRPANLVSTPGSNSIVDASCLMTSERTHGSPQGVEMQQQGFTQNSSISSAAINMEELTAPSEVPAAACSMSNEGIILGSPAISLPVASASRVGSFDDDVALGSAVAGGSVASARLQAGFAIDSLAEPPTSSSSSPTYFISREARVLLLEPVQNQRVEMVDAEAFLHRVPRQLIPATDAADLATRITGWGFSEAFSCESLRNLEGEATTIYDFILSMSSPYDSSHCSAEIQSMKFVLSAQQAASTDPLPSIDVIDPNLEQELSEDDEEDPGQMGSVTNAVDGVPAFAHPDDSDDNASEMAAAAVSQASRPKAKACKRCRFLNRRRVPPSDASKLQRFNARFLLGKENHEKLYGHGTHKDSDRRSCAICGRSHLTPFGLTIHLRTHQRHLSPVREEPTEPALPSPIAEGPSRSLRSRNSDLTVANSSVTQSPQLKLLLDEARLFVEGPDD